MQKCDKDIETVGSTLFIVYHSLQNCSFRRGRIQGFVHMR